MQNSFPPERPITHRAWSAGEVLTAAPDRQERLLGWWYRMTAVPEAPANASFVRREAARRVRLFSTVCFFFLLVLVIFLPASAFLPNHLVIYLDGLLIVFTVGTVLLNRTGRSLLAGILLVIASELTLTTVIMTTLPFDETSIQLYDLYLIVDLLGVSLLPAQAIFYLATVNSLFIGLDLHFQPQTQILAHDLVTQFIPVLVRPVGLQIIIAGVAYLWVRSATKAITRADRAEMIAALEHTIAEERASSDQARKQLEDSIRQLVEVHVDAMNRQTIAKIPYPAEARILWPLVGVINSLWVRLQRTHQMEYELQQLKHSIAAYAELLHQTVLNPQQPLVMQRTRTELDPLIQAVGNLQRALREQQR